MAIGKDTVVNVRIAKETVLYGNIGSVYYTEDVNTATITFNLMRGGYPLNLTSENMTPVITLRHSDGSEWADEVLEVVDATQGKIRYTVPIEVARHAGLMYCGLYLNSDPIRFKALEFNFRIRDSETESSIKKEIKVPLIEDTIINLLKTSSVELLDETFKLQLLSDMKDYLLENNTHFQGIPGLKGDKGADGINGIDGAQGLQGVKGEKGDKGDTGDTGVQGVQGPKGNTGENGTTLAGLNVDGTVQTFDTLDMNILSFENYHTGYYYVTNPINSPHFNNSNGLLQMIIRDSANGQLIFTVNDTFGNMYIKNINNGLSDGWQAFSRAF